MKPVLLAALFAVIIQAPQTPVELGRVRFLRSIDDGLSRAKQDDKPAFVLFQEIPG